MPARVPEKISFLDGERFARRLAYAIAPELREEDEK